MLLRSPVKGCRVVAVRIHGFAGDFLAVQRDAQSLFVEGDDGVANRLVHVAIKIFIVAGGAGGRMQVGKGDDVVAVC